MRNNMKEKILKLILYNNFVKEYLFSYIILKYPIMKLFSLCLFGQILLKIRKENFKQLLKYIRRKLIVFLSLICEN